MPFFWNLILALVWGFATGELSGGNLALGFVIGYLLLVLTEGRGGEGGYARRSQKLINLVLFFLAELIRANLRVAREIVTPREHMRPGIVAIPLSTRTDAQTTLLANLITLTPGSLSIDVSADGKVLYVHAMYIGDVEEFRRMVKEGWERRVIDVLP